MPSPLKVWTQLQSKSVAFEVTADIQGTPVFLLVDNGSTTSLISHTTAKNLRSPTTMLGVRIIAVSETFTEATSVCRGCPIDLGNKRICVDLIVTRVFHYDVILGMNWLSAMRAEIDCEDRTVAIYEDGSSPFTFPVQVSYPQRVLYYASLEEGSKELSLTYTPVVKDYVDVFQQLSRLPPRWEIDFTIELVSGTAPISLPTC
ncbi:uncharacterized protein LOC131255094 [Magnolia sinica]|uniref:uncharacterized protein LOC131255094 n=1 Tax=Magnolia sinica TaxID=86752 RepID=UPI00265AD51D|nr:uncharacterized protein LOC131255094 [Magnolia sinica]